MGLKLWSLTLREGYILRVLEKRVLRKLFGIKKEDVSGDEKIFKSRKTKYAVHVARTEEMRNA
jgi:hypothetical protein